MHESHGLLSQVKSIVRSKRAEIGAIKTIKIEYKQVEGLNDLNLGACSILWPVFSLCHISLPYEGVVIMIRFKIWARTLSRQRMPGSIIHLLSWEDSRTNSPGH